MLDSVVLNNGVRFIAMLQHYLEIELRILSHSYEHMKFYALQLLVVIDFSFANM